MCVSVRAQVYVGVPMRESALKKKNTLLVVLRTAASAARIFLQARTVVIMLAGSAADGACAVGQCCDSGRDTWIDCGCAHLVSTAVDGDNARVVSVWVNAVVSIVVALVKPVGHVDAVSGWLGDGMSNTRVKRVHARRRPAAAAAAACCERAIVQFRQRWPCMAPWRTTTHGRGDRAGASSPLMNGDSFLRGTTPVCVLDSSGDVRWEPKGVRCARRGAFSGVLRHARTT